MKLSDWADKQGIAYLTAYRWFKSNKLPVPAYQSDSGTIIVQDDSEALEQPMGISQSNDVMSTVLKKTVELSKNNGSLEDLAAWILSNFSLKPNAGSEGPRYSRVKPKSEEVQNHFKQFLRPKGEKPKPNMFVAEPGAFDDLISKADSLTTQELVDEIQKIGINGGVSVNPSEVPEVEDLFKDLSSVISSPNQNVLNVKSYGDIAEGVVQRSVDLTPQQQFNYTSSVNSAFSNYSAPDTSVGSTMFISNAVSVSPFAEFQPTQKELQSMARVSEIVDKPKRGRKPSRNSGKK
jgi:hypothetical protein